MYYGFRTVVITIIMSTITFETDSSQADARTGEGYKTVIYKVTEAKVVSQGYYGSTYIRKGGFIESRRIELGKVNGILSYAEQREWEELLS